jgi:hypothetical protein
MRKIAIALFALIPLSGVTLLQAQDMPEMPEMPAPVKEHEWLDRFVGEWESVAEITPEPDHEPIQYKSTESVRRVGGFWIVGENKGEMMGKPVTSILTLGYDPDRKKYVGTWIDSVSSYLWQYEGTVDAAGNVLTLETEGACPLEEGKTRKFRDVTEFKSPDHRVFTTSMLGDDGKWVTLMTVNSHRKK